MKDKIIEFEKILNNYRHDEDFPNINAIVFTKNDVLMAFDEFIPH